MAEFIRGNREGANRANETYHVCRFHVPEKVFEEEIAAGHHTHAVREMRVLSCCPAHGEPGPAKDESLANVPAGSFANDPSESVELVFEEGGSDGTPLYTICRLGVPRRRMVEEVCRGLHPGYTPYYVNKQPGHPDPYGVAHVQAKGDTKTANNVNRAGRPWHCGSNCQVPRVSVR